MRADPSMTLRAIAKLSVQQVLRVLLDDGGEMSVKAIAEKCGDVNVGYVSTALRAAHEVHLVTRRIQPSRGGVSGGAVNYYTASPVGIASIADWIDAFVEVDVPATEAVEPVEEIAPEVIEAPTKLSIWDRITLQVFKLFS